MGIPTLNVLSLFSGYGGLDLGIRIAHPGARTVCYVEREGYAAGVLAAHFREGTLDDAPIWTDVATFDGRPWRGVVDCIAGGFPCQDISGAGRRAGIIEGNRSGLWYEFARIIREIRPSLVFVENVSALLGRGLDIVLADLSEAGFDAEWGCFSAAEVGGSHLRERVFILAMAHAAERNGAGVTWADIGRLPAGNGSSVANVADAECEGGRGQPDASLRSTERGASAYGCSADVGDADGARRQERDECAGRGSAHAAAAKPVVGDTADDGRTDAGAGRGIATYAEAELAIPLFPPGPTDYDGWSDVLAQRPDLAPTAAKPELRDLADGSAALLDFYQRADRLRAAGNGVVPLCAAVAFSELRRRAITWEEQQALSRSRLV